eukprot:COSAG06_NODE_825_length_12067_cov_4.396975_1_plen_249_part_00
MQGTAAEEEKEEEEEEDDDGWLAVSESDVDQMLRNFSGGADASSSSEGKKGTGQRPVSGDASEQGAPPSTAEQAEMEALTARMKSFLEQSSGLDGVHGGGGSSSTGTADDDDGDEDVEEGADGHAGGPDEEEGEGVSLEMDKILKLMEGFMSGTLPPEAAEAAAAGGGEEESDDEEDDAFYDGEGSEDEEEGDGDDAEAREAMEYMERMDTELKLGGGGIGMKNPNISHSFFASSVLGPILDLFLGLF